MTKRIYRQSARAESAERTRVAILEATRAVFTEGGYDLPLEAIANRANVSVRTILRRFGSREGLLEATIAHVGETVGQDRHAEPGDVDVALRRLAAHYEDAALDMRRLAQEEHRSPAIHGVLEDARAFHTNWTEQVFAPFLDGLAREDREERLAALATLTDADVWLLLRHRHGLSKKRAETVLRRLVEMELASKPKR